MYVFNVLITFLNEIYKPVLNICKGNLRNLNKYYMSKIILLLLNSFLESFDESESDNSCRGI